MSTDIANNIDRDPDLLSKYEYTFDEYYLDFYLATLKKSESYKKACEATGFDYNKKYVSQYAQAIHKRLNSSGAIDKAMRARAQTQQLQAMNKLDQLREESDSDNIVFQVSKLQAGDIYNAESTSAGITVNVNRDHVEITHKNQTLTVKSKD